MLDRIGYDKKLSEKSKAFVKELCAEAAAFQNYDEVLHIRLGKGPPAAIEPMVIELWENARPVRVSQRLYPPESSRFLEMATDKFLNMRFLHASRKAEFIAAPLILPKVTPENLKLTIDLRPVNAATKPMCWPMPNIESEFSDMKDSRYLISIDFISVYWKRPLAEPSQVLHTFMNTKVCAMPTRTP